MPTTHVVLSFSLLLLLIVSALGCRGAGPLPGSGPEAATAIVRQMVDNGETPGVRYVFLDANEVLFETQAGTRDLGAGAPFDENTSINGYSITKTFTAAAILKLAREGRVELDAPLTTYLPELSDERVPTIRQTLQHTAGFPNPIPVGWVHLASEDEAFDDDAFFSRILRDHARLDAAPGERFAYSNVGYLILGEVVRRVSGLPYDEYVKQEIIGALGLREGEVLDFTIPDPLSHARGYLRPWSFLDISLGLFLDRSKFLAGTHHGWHELRDLYADGDAYGGIIANTGGLGRYLQSILRGDGPFTTSDVEEMFTPGATRAGKPIDTGLGWFHGELDGEPYFAHAGGAGGYYCEIRVYPNAGRASVLLTNRSAMSDDRALDRLDRLLFGGVGDEGGTP